MNIQPDEHTVVTVAAVAMMGETGHGRLFPMWLPASTVGMTHAILCRTEPAVPSSVAYGPTRYSSLRRAPFPLRQLGRGELNGRVTVGVTVRRP